MTIPTEVGWLVGWLVGLLVWFVGLLVCWFVGLLVCCFVVVVVVVGLLPHFMPSWFINSFLQFLNYFLTCLHYIFALLLLEFAYVLFCWQTSSLPILASSLFSALPMAVHLCFLICEHVADSWAAFDQDMMWQNTSQDAVVSSAASVVPVLADGLQWFIANDFQITGSCWEDQLIIGRGSRGYFGPSIIFQILCNNRESQVFCRISFVTLV